MGGRGGRDLAYCSLHGWLPLSTVSGKQCTKAFPSGVRLGVPRHGGWKAGGKSGELRQITHTLDPFQLRHGLKLIKSKAELPLKTNVQTKNIPKCHIFARRQGYSLGDFSGSL